MAATATTDRETQAEIETAAGRVIARRGVAHTSLAAVATEAGVPLAAVRAVYADEKALLHAVLLRASALGLARMAGDPDAPDETALHDAARSLLEEDGANAAPVFVAPTPLPVKVRPSVPPAPMSENIKILASAPKVRGSGSGVPLGESFGSALISLGANKMRTMLTMLGIIIGVGSVVGLLAIGNGVKNNIVGQFNELGTNLIGVSGASAKVNGVSVGVRKQSLTVEDARALADPADAPNILAVSPEMQRNGQVTAGSADFFAAIVGIWPDYVSVHKTTVASGDFITKSDVDTNARVAVIGSKVATALYGDGDPIGQTIRVTGQSFRVIGVLAPGGSSFSSPNEQVFVPLTTAQNVLFGNQEVGTVSNGKIVPLIFLKATNDKTVNAAVGEVKDVLSARHRVALDQPDFDITTQADILKQVQTTLLVIQIFLAMVAGISLLVGGIGIMNIMLVSVTERTREIGIRKAIGARQRDILTQFIVEAILIGFIGALIGVGMGFLIAILVSVAWQPATVSLSGVVVSVSVAVLTAMLFGVVPARRAARLRPIDALRYE